LGEEIIRRFYPKEEVGYYYWIRKAGGLGNQANYQRKDYYSLGKVYWSRELGRIRLIKGWGS